MADSDSVGANSKIFEEERHEDNSRENGVIQKDSRQSWLVCLGAVFLLGMAMSMGNCFGVLFVSWTREFQGSRTQIGEKIHDDYIIPQVTKRMPQLCFSDRPETTQFV